MNQNGFKFHDSWGPEYILKVYDNKSGMRGILVVDNTRLGLGKGGIRMTPNITEEEVFRLARTMTWKNALAGIPFGGAKAGMIFDPDKDRNKKEAMVRAFARAISNFVPKNYIAGPDVNSGEIEMKWIADELNSRKASTGKPSRMGGLPHELGSTGFGVAEAAKVAARLKNIDLKNAKIAIEGFGNVGSFAFKFLSKAGAKIVAVADSRGAILNNNGLDFKKLAYLKKIRKRVSDYNDAKKLTRDGFFGLKIDILILATVTDVINKSNKNKIRANIIVEGANIPMRENIEAEFHRRGILIVPDMIANAGGVISSYAEYKGYKSKKMFAMVKQNINRTTQTVLKKSLRYNKNPRQVALDLARKIIRKAS